MCTDAEGKRLARVFKEYWAWKEVDSDAAAIELRNMSSSGVCFATKNGKIFACTGPDNELKGIMTGATYL